MTFSTLRAALVGLACGSALSAPAATAGPSGLPWPSGWGCWEQQFDDFRGRASDVYIMFVGRDTRTQVVNSIGSDYIGKFANKPGKLVLSFPMLTKDIKYQFKQCAAGAFDDYVLGAANNLKKNGLLDPIIRLGWEPNGTFPWSVGGSEEKWAMREDYKQCFRRQVDKFREVIPDVQIEWDNRRDGSIRGKVEEIYPGNAYVDIIGVMMYDRWPVHYNEKSWTTAYNQTKYGGLKGLGTYLAFARQNGKKLSVPEWAVSNNDNDPASFDNAWFVKRMYKFFDDNAADIAFEGYFNCGNKTAGYRLTPDTINPDAAEAYAEAWQGPVTEPPPGPVTYQAEAATLSGAAARTTYGGYTGTAYVDYENRVGSAVQWQIQASSAGAVDLTFRYSNGSSSSRPLAITVNGVPLGGTTAFAGTGGWGTWKTKTVGVNLNSGSNTVRAQSAASSGGPHMDRVNVRFK